MFRGSHRVVACSAVNLAADFDHHVATITGGGQLLQVRYVIRPPVAGQQELNVVRIATAVFDVDKHTVRRKRLD